MIDLLLKAHDEDELLIAILEQEEKEKVSPKLEQFRPPIIGGKCEPRFRIKGARGGRAAGAKSWGLTSLIVQWGNVAPLRVACLREIQNSMEESVYELIKKTVTRLGYTGWTFYRDSIESPSGAHFIFRGLKDLRASMSIKGLEGFNIFFIEEAATISMESLNLVLPTLMRTPGAELWFCYNPLTENDPITDKIWNANRKDALLIELLPGKADNPWWNDGLQNEMDEAFKLNPDEAEHIWHGLPKKQGDYSVLPRVGIRAAMTPGRASDAGATEIGIDVARFGDDASVFFKRKGMKIVDKRTYHGKSNPELARLAWEFAGNDPSIVIRIDDTGCGGGVTDCLRELGGKVVPINFSEKAMDSDKYGDISSEMWFHFQEILGEVEIPDDTELMRQLSGRQYYYDNSGRRCVEPKRDYKKRLGRSPDDADALLLCYYNNYSFKMSNKLREQLAARRSRQ